MRRGFVLVQYSCVKRYLPHVPCAARLFPFVDASCVCAEDVHACALRMLLCAGASFLCMRAMRPHTCAAVKCTVVVQK